MTLQNAPPGLDYERDRKFSKVCSQLFVQEQTQTSPPFEFHMWNLATLHELRFLFFLLYVQSFKQMIASCLVKDPLKRPTAKKLLKHSFFKQARSNDYILRTLLEGLPALGDRIQALKVGLEFSNCTVETFDHHFSYNVVFAYKFFLVYSSLFSLSPSFYFLTEKGRRYACTKEDARWAEGRDFAGRKFPVYSE